MNPAWLRSARGKQPEGGPSPGDLVALHNFSGGDTCVDLSSAN
jgi:hypothetical protein